MTMMIDDDDDDTHDQQRDYNNIINTYTYYANVRYVTIEYWLGQVWYYLIIYEGLYYALPI